MSFMKKKDLLIDSNLFLPYNKPMKREIWKPVPGWTTYAVSNLGRVKRLIAARGTSAHRVLKPHFWFTNYYAACLSTPLGNRKYRFGRYLIHRLVMLAFVGPPPDPKMFVNHKNGIKTDNRLDNLHYVTRSENAQHASKLGLLKHPSPPCGEHSRMSTISRAMAQHILDTPRTTGSDKDLAKQLGISMSIVNYIRSRKTWKHLVPTPTELPAPSHPPQN